jgi:Antitoxin VbhA
VPVSFAPVGDAFQPSTEPLLEGLVPTSFCLSLKDRVINGEITAKQAKRDVLAHYTAKAQSKQNVTGEYVDV